jgi:hypothetical protein
VWPLAGEDELALELFGPAVTCFLALAVVALPDLGFAFFVVLLTVELGADACPSTRRDEAQAHISARAQPVPIHLRILARCFSSKGNP